MLESFADWLIFSLAGLPAGVQWADAVHFFVYETMKIGFLLIVVTHLMGLINAYLPVERVREWIASGRLRGSEHLVASGFGAVTPFCSCSSIPLFIGFLQGGIPLGVTLSFLITSPLVNEVALALFIGLFGWQVTLVYAVTGILLGTTLGWALGKLRLGRYVEDWVWDIAEGQATQAGGDQKSLWERLPSVSSEAMGIVTDIAPYVLAGLAIGAGIHGYVPTGFFEQYLSEGNPLAVPLSVVLAVPMYANASGILPVVQALVAKGVPLGTAIAFMMAVVGLSLPEAMMLKKAMQTRLLATFFGAVGVSIIGLGYLFNLVL
ncbi:permease [Salinibacter altiplanensis]|uniref:permease n=1 Tax=Salinibacter altiplanensis TaxID=1803181 RepID=UPI000C9F1564|nr:permease [Salinibacter altiplanensis]